MLKVHLHHLAILGGLLACACSAENTANASRTATDTATTSTMATASTGTTKSDVPNDTLARADHFKFWRANAHSGPPLGMTVFLKGQFDKQPWKATVDQIQYVGNPADKKNEGIPDLKLHYVVYTIKTESQTPPPVLVTNQFVTRERWQLHDPKWLLVPADVQQVDMPGIPPKGNHYVCYAATAPTPVTQQVSVVDAFDQNKPEVLQSLEARYFCVPVEKTRPNHDTERIVDAETHLAVYAIENRKHRIPARSNDQFGPRNLDVDHSEFLAVPSLKHID